MKGSRVGTGGWEVEYRCQRKRLTKDKGLCDSNSLRGTRFSSWKEQALGQGKIPENYRF